MLLFQISVSPLLHLGVEKGISRLDVLAEQSIVLSDLLFLRLRRSNFAGLVAQVLFGGLLKTLVFD
jgi:hypothetical protein